MRSSEGKQRKNVKMLCVRCFSSFNLNFIVEKKKEQKKAYTRLKTAAHTHTYINPLPMKLFIILQSFKFFFFVCVCCTHTYQNKKLTNKKLTYVNEDEMHTDGKCKTKMKICFGPLF